MRSSGSCLEEIGSLFGGYILWNAPATPTEAMPGDGLGVWRGRNVARLRRVLRERGAEVERVDGSGPTQTLKAVSQDYRDYPRRPAPERDDAADVRPGI